VGAQATLGVVRGAHNFTAGLYGFVEHDDRQFRLADQSGLSINEKEPVTGGVATLFFDEQYKPFSWLTLNGGVRLTHFSGEVNENAANPRIGAAVRVPKLNWVLRGFYGRYYQPPPLETIAGPLLQFALQEGIGFLPVPGERNEQHEFGVTIPYRGWTVDLSHFRTAAKNFSDHDVLGNSNITLPLAIESATVRGWEAVIHSPEMFRRIHFHLAYSNQVVKGQGAVVGGLTDFAPPSEGFFYIDHDQRHTLSVGGEVTLPRHAWINSNVSWGSGFLDQDGPQHLPPHTSVDIAFGKSFGENLSFTVSALNIADSRFLYGRESSFAGTHYNEPRQIIGSIRYRFHF
jgi:outer membrane receptor protein involved in Fe transport